MRGFRGGYLSVDYEHPADLCSGVAGAGVSLLVSLIAWEVEP